MYCNHCGTPLPPGARFCNVCGTPVPHPDDAPAAPPPYQPARQAAPSYQPAQPQSPTGTGGYSPNGGYPPNGGQPPYQSRNIVFCDDGKYRWTYEVHMMKNPVLIITVFKAFGVTFLIMWVLMAIIGLLSGDGLDAVLGITKVVLIMIAIFVPLIFIAFLIVAAINGWKYVVLFEMDEQGVLHQQLNRQVKRSKAIAWLAILAGLAGGNRGAVSAGIVATVKQSSYSSFARVRMVKPIKKWNTIKVGELLEKNQVYAETEDFDFVCQYILAHCPRAKQ